MTIYVFIVACLIRHSHLPGPQSLSLQLLRADLLRVPVLLHCLSKLLPAIQCLCDFTINAWHDRYSIAKIIKGFIIRKWMFYMLLFWKLASRVVSTELPLDLKSVYGRFLSWSTFKHIVTWIPFALAVVQDQVLQRTDTMLEIWINL